MKRILLYIVLFLAFQNSEAQELQLELPFHAGKEASIAIQRGVLKDTLYSVKLDAHGQGTVDMSEKLHRTSVIQLGSLGENVQYGFVMQPTDNVVLTCKEEYIHRQNAALSGAPESDSLNHWFDSQTMLKQREMGITQLLPHYESTSSFGRALENEKEEVAQQLTQLTHKINASIGFAAHFFKTRQMLETTIAQAWQSDQSKVETRNFLRDELDLEMLYGSGMWFEVLNSSIEVYSKGTIYYEKLGEDMVHLMRKTSDDEVMMALADAALSICETFSWPKDQEVIVEYLVTSGRVKNPKGKLKNLIAMHQTAVGKPAPDLVLVKHVGDKNNHQHQTTTLKLSEMAQDKTLLVFYQSGCGPCENTMNMLRGNYEDLQSKGVHIISLSADIDEQIFKNTAASYPWSDKYCDYDGKSGINFTNYAIIGTPTMYLLDGNGIILSKMATIEELMEELKRQENG